MVTQINFIQDDIQRGELYTQRSCIQYVDGDIFKIGIDFL